MLAGHGVSAGRYGYCVGARLPGKLARETDPLVSVLPKPSGMGENMTACPCADPKRWLSRMPMQARRAMPE